MSKIVKAKNHVCPRCGGNVPNDRDKGRYPGALSRVANYEICSQCGTDEAIRDFHKMPPVGLSSWAMNQK